MTTSWPPSKVSRPAHDDPPPVPVDTEVARTISAHGSMEWLLSHRNWDVYSFWTASWSNRTANSTNSSALQNPKVLACMSISGWLNSGGIDCSGLIGDKQVNGGDHRSLRARDQ